VSSIVPLSSWSSTMKLCNMIPLGLAACAILLATTPNGFANGTIAFNGETVSLSGTWIGSEFTLMTLQQNGSEFGSVSWNGSADVIDSSGGAGTGASQTQTQPISALSSASIGATNLGVVLQVNQASGGKDPINLTTFTLNVYNNAGTIIDSATFTAGGSNASTSALTGTGTGTSGWLFHVSGLNASDFTTSTNRIGIIVPSGSPITGSDDGPDTFFLANAGAATVVTPEPASISLLGFGAPDLGGMPLATAPPGGCSLAFFDVLIPANQYRPCRASSGSAAGPYVFSGHERQAPQPEGSARNGLAHAFGLVWSSLGAGKTSQPAEAYGFCHLCNSD
jgi:hypothetical protein